MSRPRWKNPDKRRALAVELRRDGWSLRRIATELAVDEATVRRDLSRWEQEQVEALLRHSAAAFRTDAALMPHQEDQP